MTPQKELNTIVRDMKKLQKGETNLKRVNEILRLSRKSLKLYKDDIKHCHEVLKECKRTGSFCEYKLLE